MPVGPLGRIVFQCALLFVPRRWRAEVRRDLIEESRTRSSRWGSVWLARQAVAVGLRLRLSPRTAGAEPRAPWFEPALRDLKYAVRSLSRARTWTLMAVATLAIGIGANTAVFSVVNTAILNPLPYRDADRLVLPGLTDERNTMGMTASVAMAKAWRAQATTLEAIELYSLRRLTLTGAGDPVMVDAAAISDTLAAFTGVPVVLGRGFTSTETAPGAPPVAMVAERMWRQTWDADPAVIGRTLTLDGVPHEIVGVMSDDLRFIDELQGQPPREVFVPLRDETGVRMIARLAVGATQAQSTAELHTIIAGAQLNREGSFVFRADLRRPSGSSSVYNSLVMLFWAVMLVLLIACVNVAHLVLSRGLSRERELAIRSTLGARRGQIARQLVAEGLVLAAAGGVAGVLLGAWMLDTLKALRPPGLQSLAVAVMDWRVMAAAALTSLATGLSFGLVANWRAGRVGAAAVLRAAGTASEGRAKGRLRSVLVVAEVAAAAVLLVGALLLIRSVANLQQVNLGFDAKQLYTIRVPLPPARCTVRAAQPTPEWCRIESQRWLDQVRAIPGVDAATLAATAPPQMDGMTITPWETQTGTSVVDGMRSITSTNRVRPEYFAVTGMRILDGRPFDAGSAARRDVIVSEALAARLWPSVPAVGQLVRPAPVPGSAPEAWFTVVGVTADAAIRDVRRYSGELVLYYASDHGGPTLVLRARPDTPLAAAVRRIGLDINPQLAIPAITEVATALDEGSVATRRFDMQLLAVFAAVASLLSAVGLYGVLAHAIAQRTREIGIRLALGGSSAHVARIVVARAMALTGVGLVLGLAAARASTGFLSRSLYGVTPFDLVAYGGTALLMIVVAIVACLAPLARAMRVDPLAATRAE